MKGVAAVNILEKKSGGFRNVVVSRTALLNPAWCSEMWSQVGAM